MLVSRAQVRLISCTELLGCNMSQSDFVFCVASRGVESGPLVWRCQGGLFKMKTASYTSRSPGATEVNSKLTFGLSRPPDSEGLIADMA